MEQFLAVALAHFLALLIPGVDFFLIVRASLAGGWRNATGACLGIATANGLFITAAFSGVSLISHPVVLAAVQFAGGVFLIFVGVAFLRTRATVEVAPGPALGKTTWLRNYGLGLASGLLNPKNAVFYLSLAAVLGGAKPTELVAYGAWMFSIVLIWDVFVALALGSQRALVRLGRFLPWMTKLAGAVLILLGVGMLLNLIPVVLQAEPMAMLGQ